MPPMASRGTQRDVAVEGLASGGPFGSATTGDASDEQGQVAVARALNGCGLPTRPQRGDGSGLRRVGSVFFSLLVRVLRRVEPQGGFRGA